MPSGLAGLRLKFRPLPFDPSEFPDHRQPHGFVSHAKRCGHAHAARLADYLELEPDLVVAYEGVNDVGQTMLGLVYPLRASLWQRVLKRSSFVRGHLSRILYPNDAQIQRDLDSFTIGNLGVIHSVLARKGVRMAICSIAHPTVSGISGQEEAYLDYVARTQWGYPFLTARMYCGVVDMLNKGLQEFCRNETILYVPVAENLQGTEYFGDTCHLRDPGIERKAEIVCEYLKDYIRPVLVEMAQRKSKQTL